MSFLSFVLVLVVLAGGCFASWKGALYWHQRTRDAQEEDPRDQEIRELGATLSIARKNLAKLGGEQECTNQQATELREKLDHVSDTFADTQQKFNATKEHLQKEIEDKEHLTEDIAHLRRELEKAQARAMELEVQAKLTTSDNALISGDQMLGQPPEEAQKLAESENLVEQLKIELARWKQHCAVISKTNKEFRGKAEQQSQ